MLKKIGLAIGVLIAAVLVFASMKADTFNVQRTVAIKGSTEKVFSQIADFHNWASWSPWEKLDPAMKKSHSGAASGKGAIYEWDGNDKVGKGRMEIFSTIATNRVTIKLDFLRPFEAHNTAMFSLVERGEITEVTWARFGPSPFPTRLMTVFVSMDSMVGKDFELGLANLKTVVESK